jgi:hypothetical protein
MRVLFSRFAWLLTASLTAGCAMTDSSTPSPRDASRSDRAALDGAEPSTDGALVDAPPAQEDVAAPRDAVLMTDVRPVDGGCPLGLIACGALCVSIAVDVDHCGACGNRCRVGANATALCDDGRCAAMCAPGFADCDRDLSNGCEVDTRTSVSHCGRCNNGCSVSNATAACVAGSCAVGSCMMGFGRACAGATPVCDARSGTCVSGCASGQQRCGASCVDTSADIAHCGGCDRRCAVSNGAPRCEAGVCRVLACNAGFADCDGNPANGCEVNTRTDPMNCGGCGSRPAEVCNGVDDNCDGVVDEGFRAQGVGSTYTTLRGFHDGCNGSTERFGRNCNAAIHRFCAARGCTTSGFGPVENDGDIANVVCVRGEVVVTTYTALRGFHGPCDGVGQRMGPDCNAAIHRLCAARGAVSGFGPIENDGDTAVVTCVSAPSAQSVMTTYTALREFHVPCDGSTERFGRNCNAAINRFCASRGFEGGFGPVENSGDTAFVTCVRR